MIKVSNLTKIYKSFNVETIALNAINLEIQDGEFLSIMGPSGCGKSTLLNILALLDRPTNGEVFFMGESIGNMSDKRQAFIRKNYVGFVFQNFNLIDELSVYENIELPLIYQKIAKAERHRRTVEIMEQLNIAHKSQFFPLQLSGGQQQRVAIARAVVTQPLFLLADEPTGNLDSVQGEEVMNILSQLNNMGTSIVLVTHSLNNTKYSQRTIHLFDGQIVTENIQQFI